MQQAIGFGHAAIESTLACAPQAVKHIQMYFSGDKRRGMQRTPDEKREIIRKFMAERALKPATWAKAAGVNKNSLYNFLNGHSDGLDTLTYGKLARAAEVPSWRLTGEQPELSSPTTIWVSGHIEAGSFRDAIEWDRSLWYPVDVPIPQRFRGKAKALEVRGPSMNLIYPEGSVVIWVEMLDFRPPRHEDKVVVYAHYEDDTIEATVKEVRVDGTERWLWPRSSDPAHQVPVNTKDPGPHVKSIEIRGIVIGSYRGEVF